MQSKNSRTRAESAADESNCVRGTFTSVLRGKKKNIVTTKNIYYLRLRTNLDGGGIGCEGSRTVIPPSTNITIVQSSSFSLSDGVKLASVVYGSCSLVTSTRCSLSSQVLGKVRTKDVFAALEHPHLLNCCWSTSEGTTVRCSKRSCGRIGAQSCCSA